jgi:hypothetical protein
MDKHRKKELIRTYKELKPNPGIFAVRCKPTGQTWVASSPNLDNRQGGVWSQLRMGGNRFNATLHAAWKEHGEEAFAFEVLEEVQDENTLLIPALLKERVVHWRKELGAAALIG